MSCYVINHNFKMYITEITKVSYQLYYNEYSMRSLIVDIF